MATSPPSVPALWGGDVIDQEVVSDGEETDGGKSDGARSDRSARSGTAKGKKRAAKDSNPPAPPQKLASKGNAAAPQKAALGSPLREPGSPGTVPMIVYREACRDRDQFRQERDAARLAAEAATRLKEELDTVKRQRDDLQASSWTLSAKGLPLRHAWRCCSGPRA